MIDGGDAIRQARQDVDDFGLSISAVDAANIERANDAFANVMRLIDVIRQRLAAALAPVIEMISNRFTDVARESGGFEEAIDKAIKLGVRGFAALADTVEVVRRAFVVVGAAVTLFMAGTVRDVAVVTEALITGPVGAINALISAMNKIPGISIEQVAPPGITKMLKTIAEEATFQMESAQQRIVDVFTTPLPGEAFVEAYENAVESANAASAAQIEAAAERNRRLAELGDERMEDIAEQVIAEDEIDRDALERRLDRLRESLMDEEELEANRFQQRLGELRAFHDAGLVDTDEYYDKLEQVASQHEASMNRIRQKSASDQGKTARQLAEDVFGSNKIAALANALLSAREAITGAYAVGARHGGPPLGAAFAAAAGAAQFAQVSAIRSTSLSGGGPAVASGGGGNSAVAAQASAQAPSGPTQTLQVAGISPGQLFSGQAVRDLASKLLDFQRDGGKVVFAD